MTGIITISVLLKQGYFILLKCGIILLLLSNMPANAQEMPPRPVLLSTVQNLSFGAFYQGTGGTVIISSGGARSYTGDIVLVEMGYSYFQTIIEVDAIPGTIISITNGPDINLSDGSGHLMNLHIGASNPVSPFVTTAIPPAKTQVNIGGTLTVGDPVTNPPGSYNGVFFITFNQE